MIRAVLIQYLIEGKPVGAIAESLGVERADVRAQLKDGGITLRPTDNGYALGRDPVCDAVKRAGYPTFHYFAQCMAMEPLAEQTSELGVSARALDKVYNVYRRLLVSLKADGIKLPTSQKGYDDLEHSA